MIENWWESHDLTKIDLSNNEIPDIPDEIASQEVSVNGFEADIFSHIVRPTPQFELKCSDHSAKWSVQSSKLEVPGHSE